MDHGTATASNQNLSKSKELITKRCPVPLFCQQNRLSTINEMFKESRHDDHPTERMLWRLVS